MTAVPPTVAQVRDQLLFVSAAQTSGLWPAHWDGAISDVGAIAARLLATSPRRLHGSSGAHPLLVRAGAGTGKTWASKQLVALLAAADQSDSAVPLLVLLVSVQRLARILREQPFPETVETAGGAVDLIQLYIEREYAESERYRRALLQAREMAALVLVIDGIDGRRDAFKQCHECIECSGAIVWQRHGVTAALCTPQGGGLCSRITSLDRSCRRAAGSCSPRGRRVLHCPDTRTASWCSTSSR